MPVTAWLETGSVLMSHGRNTGGLVILEVTHVIPLCYESYKDQTKSLRAKSPPELLYHCFPGLEKRTNATLINDASNTITLRSRQIRMLKLAFKRTVIANEHQLKLLPQFKSSPGAENIKPSDVGFLNERSLQTRRDLPLMNKLEGLKRMPALWSMTPRYSLEHVTQRIY